MFSNAKERSSQDQSIGQAKTNKSNKISNENKQIKQNKRIKSATNIEIEVTTEATWAIFIFSIVVIILVFQIDICLHRLDIV